MKLFVWEERKDYEGLLTFAIAENIEEAKKLIIIETGYSHIYKYPDILPDFLNDSPDVYEVNKPVAFYMSHSG